jgi:ParB family chromosome partitioning protein
VGSGYGLGRGLEALIPAATTASGAEEVAVTRISPNPHQPRRAFADSDLEALAGSIRSHGILQPLVVRVGAGGDYELVAGERRLRAARMAGLTHVPVIVRTSTEVEMLQLALIENLQRADLNPLEEALAFDELASSFGLTHEQIANQVGRSRAAVSNAIRLLDLAGETRRALLEGRISEGHGRALAALTQIEVQEAALSLVLERRLSVRKTEELVRRRARADRWPAGGSDDLNELEARLRDRLATRVSIVRSRRGGRIVIEFGTDEELERLAGLIEGPTVEEPVGPGWPA